MDDPPVIEWVRTALRLHLLAQTCEVLGLEDKCREHVGILRDLLDAMPRPAFEQTLRALGYDPTTGRPLTQRICRNCRAAPGALRHGVTPSGGVYQFWVCDPCQDGVDRVVDEIRRSVAKSP